MTSLVGFVGGVGVAVQRQRGQRVVVRDESGDAGWERRRRERRDLQQVKVPAFEERLKEDGIQGLIREQASTLQINIGLTCNQTCSHCHVESSPSRKETMPKIVADRLVELTSRGGNIKTVDISGGAPEMHEQFRPLVQEFRGKGMNVMDRCNLTILNIIPDLAEFLAENRVKVVASLPCYTPDNVEAQRGVGVFDSSIEGLQKLNALGYGVEGSGLELDLVYNPGGAFLPPPQEKLTEDYRRELWRAFEIQFSSLIAIANMPIKRFADDLMRQNKLEEYMNLLVDNFNPSTVPNVMCLDQVHVSWNGQIYDCDFNYALDMPVPLTAEEKVNRSELLPRGLTVFDIESWDDLKGRRVLTAKHCYGCTAGSGSSCGGVLT